MSGPGPGPSAARTARPAPEGQQQTTEQIFRDRHRSSSCVGLTIDRQRHIASTTREQAVLLRRAPHASEDANRPGSGRWGYNALRQAKRAKRYGSSGSASTPSRISTAASRLTSGERDAAVHHRDAKIRPVQSRRWESRPSGVAATRASPVRGSVRELAEPPTGLQECSALRGCCRRWVFRQADPGPTDHRLLRQCAIGASTTHREPGCGVVCTSTPGDGLSGTVTPAMHCGVSIPQATTRTSPSTSPLVVRTARSRWSGRFP
jgi:hypothetical protein